MQTIKVKKTDLIEILQKNRTVHESDYVQAREGWLLKVREALVEAVRKLDTDGEVQTHFALPKPENHTNEYNRLIGMLELDTGTHVDLTQQEYSQYVMDEWQWKSNVTTINAMYSGS